MRPLRPPTLAVSLFDQRSLGSVNHSKFEIGFIKSLSWFNGLERGVLQLNCSLTSAFVRDVTY